MTADPGEQPIDQAEALAQVEALRAQQAGVVARRQARAVGMGEAAIATRIRRRVWVKVHDGVYAGHTGELTWIERAWAAVLWAHPAALSHTSAMRVVEGPGRRGRDSATIHVAISRSRRLYPPAGVVVHRTAHLDERAQWNLAPPRIRYADAVIDVAVDSGDDLGAIAVLADACGSRRTTATRLLETLSGRPRLGRRGWLVGVLADVATGTCSVLEHGYLDLVERPHGLPEAVRQRPRATSGGGTIQDASYEEARVIVELDGRLGHSSAEDRHDDLDRDLDNAASHDELTLRIGYRQVFRDGCATAAKVGQVLRRRGWGGVISACADCDESGL